MSIDELLDYWDFPDTKKEVDGYDLKTVPTASDDNFRVLIEKINELISEVNQLKRDDE